VSVKFSKSGFAFDGLVRKKDFWDGVQGRSVSPFPSIDLA
jgi:hypothetical protein